MAQIQSGPVRNFAVPEGKGSIHRGFAPQSLQFDTLSPEGQNIVKQAGQTGLGMIGKPQFNTGQYQFDFAPIGREARQNFYQNTIPSLAERFSGLGAGSQRSSAFSQSLGQAGAGLESALASLESQYGLQNRGQEAQIGLQNQGQLIQYILSLLGLGTQRTSENAYIPRQPGIWESAGKGVANAGANAIGTGAGIYFGNKIAG